MHPFACCTHRIPLVCPCPAACADLEAGPWYDSPRKDGIRIDWCLSYEAECDECGAATALFWCQSQGWAGLVGYGGPGQAEYDQFNTLGSPGHNSPLTAFLGEEGGFCVFQSGPSCGRTFTYIECKA